MAPRTQPKTTAKGAMAQRKATADRNGATNKTGVDSDGSDVMAKFRAYLDAEIKSMEDQRLSWWYHWGQLAEYILPRRYKWLLDEAANTYDRGLEMNQSIMDSTATISARILAAGMMAGITSPAKKWFSAVIPDDDLMQQDEVKIYLETVRDRLLHIMAEGNFYNVTHTAYMDLGIFGTACNIIYEDFDDVFRSYPSCAGEYYLGLSDRYTVNKVGRKFVMSVAQVVQKFGRDNCSPTVQSLYDTPGGRNKNVNVCHLIEPDEPGDGYGRQTNLAFREAYWEWGSAQTCCLSTRGFHEFPAVAPRWDVVSNDPYGRSPGMDALPDVRQLQLETRRKAQAIDKMVNPPMLADVSLKNQPATMLPGGVTYVNATAGAQGFKPVYEVMPPISEMKEDIKEIQQRIQRTFYNDLFMAISQLDTVRSAEEIRERSSEKLIQLGPTLERFENEYLNPAINRMFQIANRAGVMPPPPKALQNREIQIQYSSMLSDAQKAMSTGNIERLWSFAGNLGAVKPEVFDKLDIDETMDEYSDFLGVNPKIIVSTDQAKQVRAARDQAQAQQYQLQQSQAAAAGAKTLSETNVGNGQNALAAALGNQGGAPGGQ